MNVIVPKWKGILNPPICISVLSSFHNQICNMKNVAVIYPTNQYMEYLIKCPVYEVSGLFLNTYGSFLVSKGFQQKEKINQAYTRMREVGIIERMSKRYGMKKDAVKNFQDHYSDKYNVQDEGVMFDHVKIIVIAYFMFLPIPLLVLLIEIVVHRYKNRR